MTSYDAGSIGCYGKTLTANAVDTVTFAEDLDKVEVLSNGAAAIYVTVDGSDPTIGSGDSWEVPATPCARTLPVPTSGKTIVKLRSSGAPAYSVSKES